MLANKPAGENGEDKKEGREDGSGEGKGNSDDANELKCDEEEKKETPSSAYEAELKKLDPVNGDKIINQIKEETKINDEVVTERVPPPVTSNLVRRKIVVDLSLEKNFNPDEYYQMLTNYMDNDTHLADRISETFGKFEVEEKFPLHTKRIVIYIFII